jgi:hypothetical protein
MENEIKTHKIPWHLPKIPAGWGNGYVGVPEGHPWFNKHYDDIDASVHGGLTYGRNHLPMQEPDGYWWVGFDTGHYGDNKFNCPEIYVDAQIELLKQQAIAAQHQT